MVDQLAERSGTHSFPPIQSPKQDQTSVIAPIVSILIPVHNRADLTQVCFETLFAHADPSLPTEIIVIDDYSTDETPQFLRSLGTRVRVIRNEQRQCFGHNMNHAAETAKGKYLCLLNNDTRVTAGWLRTLVETIEANPAIGVVGNKHLFPETGKLNHCGMVFDGNGFPWHLHPGLDADLPAANVSREFQIVTAACWLVPKQLFVSLGGFDPNFRNGFEDVDFCLRVRERHRKVFYCAESVIYHHGQSSPGRKDNDQANWEYFQSKWKGRIVSDLSQFLFQDGMTEAPLPDRLPPFTRSSVADIHFAIPVEVTGSFTWVTSSLALALEDLGMKVSLKPTPINPSVGAEAMPRMQSMMLREPSKRVQIKWNHFWEMYLAEELSGDINAEIFVTNYRYGRRSVHELDRWMRQVVLGTHRKLPISQFCHDALTELGVPEERSAILPLGFSPEILTVEGKDERFRDQGTVFLAITNSHDLPRYGTDILLKAYDQAFSPSDDVVLVLKDYSMRGDQSLLADWLRQRRGGPRVLHLMEFVDKEALVRMYRGANVFVAPFRGEGFGMKIVDAAAAGLPILAPAFGGPVDYLIPGGYFPVKYRETPVGECLDRVNSILPDFATWIEPDVDDLAEQMRSVVHNKEEAKQRATLEQQFVLKNFSWKNAAERLIQAIERFEKQRRHIVEPRRLHGPAPKKLSILMPTYNRADVLSRCLDAYRQQSLDRSQWELVLIDDKSNYSVAELVKNKGEGLPIELLVNETNCGQGQSRNRAIPKTKGELLLFTGDDIIPDRNFLEEHVRAHTATPAEQLAVLGQINWHPDVEITPMMAYVTGDGGQQFFFDALGPGKFAPHNFFYTSNVSLKRSFLIEQEDLFNKLFVCYGYEDVELALRLSRMGMKMIYHPKARAGHLHAMTDQNLVDRQQKIGRMLLIYLLLHPEQRPMEHLVFIQWMEIVQHLLMKDPEFLRIRDELAQFSHALQEWMDRFLGTVQSLNRVLNPDRFDHAASGPAFQKEGKQRLWLNKVLFAHRFDLALRSGMADEWMGTKPSEPNAARDLLHVLQCTTDWNLFGRDTPLSVRLPQFESTTSSRALRLARHLKHHPWLEPFWFRVKQMPGYRVFNKATKKMLKIMS